MSENTVESIMKQNGFKKITVKYSERPCATNSTSSMFVPILYGNIIIEQSSIRVIVTPNKVVVDRRIAPLSMDNMVQISKYNTLLALCNILEYEVSEFLNIMTI